MAHTLVIVESPTKSKTIGRYLDGWKPNHFRVSSSVGHVVDLPERTLGVDLAKDFEPHYVHAPRKAKVIAELRKLAKEAGEVLLATDQDREGEAIAWHIANLLKGYARKGVPVHRIRFNEITKSAIVDAVQHPEDIDQNRVDAQQARRVMDRLVGYQVSPILWKTVSRGLSAGRVQSVAVRLICEREEEIQAFVPQEYWSFIGRFGSAQGEAFEAELLRVFESAAAAGQGAAKAGEKPEVRTQAEALALKAEMEAAAWSVQAIGEKQTARKAPPPFITSTLQQDAARRLGFAPKKTMVVAQQLYEGLELENGERAGLITYMRTDSMRLADSAVAEARQLLTQRYGADVVPDKPNVYRGKNKAQDAHEAIRPTSLAWAPEQLAHSLNRDQLRLYTLIWNRFLASQMVPALFNQRSIDLVGGRFIFRATGSVLARKGYLEVYEDQPEAEKPEGAVHEAGHARARARSGAPARQEKSIPVNIREGERADLKELAADQHFTKPPARFSQESLIKALEELGIGRPSTYASIVDMILKRKYVELKERRFLPTPLGVTVNRILVTHFAVIFNVDFTAQMELELDSVESGRDWRSVVQDFYGPFAVALGAAESAKAEIRASTREEVGEACPDCGQALVYKHGRNGRFISCTNYPACKYSRNPGGDEKHPQTTEETCEACGAPMTVKHSRYGPFLGCSRYPECKQTKPFDLGAACPKPGCEGKLGERRSKRGKTFFGCTRYPACDYASWDRPEPYACPACDWPWLGRKTGRDRDHELTCPRCGSTHDEGLLKEMAEAASGVNAVPGTHSGAAA